MFSSPSLISMKIVTKMWEKHSVSKHLRVFNRKWEIISHRGWHEEDVSCPPSFQRQFTDFIGIKTVKVMHFFKDNILKRASHDSAKSTWLHTGFLLCAARLIQPCKVKEVNGQSVAHLNWLTAAWCNTCASPPNTERYCSLLTDAVSSWNNALLSRFAWSLIMKMTGYDEMMIPSCIWDTRGGCLWLLRWGSHLVLACIIWDVILSDLSRALLW